MVHNGFTEDAVQLAIAPPATAMTPCGVTVTAWPDDTSRLSMQAADILLLRMFTAIL